MIPAHVNLGRQTGGALRVARWCRVSTEEQTKEGTAGLQRQYDQTDRVIAARGYEVVNSFEVVAVSGTSVALTPEFNELLRLVRTRSIQAVVVAEVSRLMRVDSWESMSVLDEFAKHRCLIITDGFEIDLSNPEGFLSGGIQTLFAGHERMKLVQKIAAAKMALKRQGKLASAEHTLPRGVQYDWTTFKFSFDPAAVWPVQEAFRLIDEEGIHNLAEVARCVGFKRTGLRGTLENRIYLGFRRYHEKRDMTVKRVGHDGRNTQRPRIPCEPDEVIEVRVIDEPAVPPERFQRVQNILAELKLNHRQKLSPEKLVHLCTSFGRCGCCGSTLYTVGNGKRHHETKERLLWYICRSQNCGRNAGLPRCSNSWVAKAKLDRLLAAFTTKVLTDPETLTALLAGALKLSSEVIRRFPQRGSEDAIAKLERKEKRLISMCEAEAISIHELKAERIRIREEIARLRSAAEQSKPAEEPLTAEALARLVIKGAMRFSRLTDPREQKAILEQLFAEVYFRDETITAFRFHPALVASMGDDGSAFGHAVTLETPFRPEPQLPAANLKCSKCSVVLPRADFPKARLLCPLCFRDHNRERSRKYRAKCRALS